MGLIFSKLYLRLFGMKQVRILILGLDNAGKTTILYQLHMNEVVKTVPTIGFNVETVQHGNLKLQVWDLGGQQFIRPYWRCYFCNTDAVIFVVDSSDINRLPDAKKELHLLLKEEELKNVSLLVFANKQDLPDALGVMEISNGLELTSIRNREWAIMQTSATKATGLVEGLDWLTNVLSRR